MKYFINNNYNNIQTYDKRLKFYAPLNVTSKLWIYQGFKIKLLAKSGSTICEKKEKQKFNEKNRHA